MSNSLETQIGGSHYKDQTIQPIQYIEANNIGFIEGNIIKYASRHHRKGGVADIDKIIHYAQLLKQLRYNNEEEQA
jgi:hypothetical protein